MVSQFFKDFAIIIILITCLSILISISQLWLDIPLDNLFKFVGVKANELWWVTYGSLKEVIFLAMG